MSRERENHAPDEKAAILKRHLVEKTPVSDRCDELGLNPTVFFGWQEQHFDRYNMVRLHSAVGYVTRGGRDSSAIAVP